MNEVRQLGAGEVEKAFEVADGNDTNRHLDRRRMAALWKWRVASGQSAVFALFGGDRCLGGCGANVRVDDHDPERSVGSVSFWWTEAGARGRGGIDMLRSAERWAESKGADEFFVTLPAAAKAMNRLGYTEAAVVYRRKLNGN